MDDLLYNPENEEDVRGDEARKRLNAAAKGARKAMAHHFNASMSLAGHISSSLGASSVRVEFEPMGCEVDLYDESGVELDVVDDDARDELRDAFNALGRLDDLLLIDFAYDLGESRPEGEILRATFDVALMVDAPAAAAREPRVPAGPAVPVSA